jgi:hypothetical protein
MAPEGVAVELSVSQARKVNPPLRTILERAAPGDAVRAILLLRPSSFPETPLPPDPGAFPNRQAYREALIEQQRRLTEATVRPVLERLHALDLHPRGGQLNAIVVEGRAERFLQALELPQVSQAILDEPLTIPPPHRPGGKSEE